MIFGGAGRYYDRVGFNFAFDERFKAFQFNKEIFFSVAGGMRGGVNTVAWNPIYLTPAGLDPLLAATPAIRQLVQKRARPAEILALALSEGMRSLRQDGIEKVLAGQTSLAEVRASTND